MYYFLHSRYDSTTILFAGVILFFLAAGHLTYECRNFIRVDPTKDVHLDISSTSSEESDKEGDISISSTSTPTSSSEEERRKRKQLESRCLVSLSLSLSLNSIVFLQGKRRESIEGDGLLQTIAGQGHDQDPGLDLKKDAKRKRHGIWMLTMNRVCQICLTCVLCFEDY